MCIWLILYHSHHNNLRGFGLIIFRWTSNVIYGHVYYKNLSSLHMKNPLTSHLIFKPVVRVCVI